jgi:hypothetical protein
LLLSILLIFLKNKQKINTMKKLFNWIGGFFSSESGTSSSKRLVGIVGAGTLYYTLYSNSHSEAHFTPSDALVWGTVALSGLALGLATAKELGDMVRGLRGEKSKETSKTEENGND